MGNKVEQFARDAHFAFLAHPDWIYGADGHRPTAKELKAVFAELEQTAWDCFEREREIILTAQLLFGAEDFLLLLPTMMSLVQKCSTT